VIENFDIAVLGNWHLSSVTAAVLASHGKKTLWVNHDKKNPWTDFPAIPVMEPGLEDKISKARAQNLLQHSNGFETWRAPIVWMAIDTPVNDRDEVDCSPLNQAIEELKKQGI
jgi:UDP-glucose 6-dehydrogenase